jgi:hypothetical protein
MKTPMKAAPLALLAVAAGALSAGWPKADWAQPAPGRFRERPLLDSPTAAKARIVEIAGLAGMKIDPGAVGESITATVRNPVQPGLTISATAPTSFDPEVGANGQLSLAGGEGAVASGWVDLTLKMEAHKPYALDCEVAGATTYYIGFDHNAAAGNVTAVAHNGRIGMLAPARDTAGARVVTIIGQGSNHYWTFASCTATPVG